MLYTASLSAVWWSNALFFYFSPYFGGLKVLSKELPSSNMERQSLLDEEKCRMTEGMEEDLKLRRTSSNPTYGKGGWRNTCKIIHNGGKEKPGDLLIRRGVRSNPSDCQNVLLAELKPGLWSSVSEGTGLNSAPSVTHVSGSSGL